MKDDKTPVERAGRPAPTAAHPANEGLVRALHNHVLVLEHTARRVTAIEERICSGRDPVAAAEHAALGRAFRQEADSAHELARAAEKLAAAGGGG